MMKFVFLLLPFCAAAKVIVQGRLTRGGTERLSDVFRLNGWIFLSLVAVMSALFLRCLPRPSVLLLSLGFGLLNAAFQFFYAMAFRSGSVSLAAVINNFNLILPILAGILWLGDPVKPANLAGMALLALPLILIPRPDGGKTEKRWFFCSVAAFLAAGGSNVVLLAASRMKLSDAEHHAFVIFGFAFACLLNFLLSFLITPRPAFRLDRRSVLPILAIGVLLGSYNLLLVASLKVVSSVVLYPVVNVLTVALIVLYDRVVQGLRLTRRQIIGLAAGMVCILLLSL